MNLDELLSQIKNMEGETKAALLADANTALGDPIWVPNPGPQHDAYYCEADEMFYGGQAGGGKSDLLLGLALTQHRNSLLLRRFGRDVRSLVDRCAEIIGTRLGFNGQDQILRCSDQRVLEFGGCQHEDDKQRYKGRPHDLICFDEIADFSETQYTFVLGWNRSAEPGQRCRSVATGNPPTRPEGLWVLKRFAAWLDPKHPNPAKPGELRWFTTNDKGQEIEVDGPGPHLIDGRTLCARSRTFIPAKVSDNPDLKASGYQATLDALPAAMRSAYRDGNFQAQLQDEANQLIPTAWVEAAFARWSPDGGRGCAMTAIAIDPAGGGPDAAEIAFRHGGWFGEIESIIGSETADGSSMAARIIRRRRNQCPVIVEAGGGYGGAIIQRLADNGIRAINFNGARTSTEGAKDGSRLKFYNKRAEAWWRLREGLNPDQDDGSIIALPPDNELKADLTAPRLVTTERGIKIELKDDIRKRIGRSPGKGDVVALAWSEGEKAGRRALMATRPIEVQGVRGYNPLTGQYDN